MKKSENNSKIYLDVRTKGEFDERHVPGAIHFDITRLMKGELPEGVEKDAEIFVYCLSGGRAAAAAQVLKMRGFTNVLNAGGIDSLM